MSFVFAEDKALKAYLSGMTVMDEKQNPRPVKVWFGYPDIEIRNQEFPFAVIDLISIRPALDRQQSGIISDNDNQGTQAPTIFTSNVYTIYEYEYPVAYDLSYQITTYSRHPLHDRSIIIQMHKKFPAKYGFLPILNDLGTETAYRHMFLDEFRKYDTADEVNGSRRLLRNLYTIRVVSEMTPTQAATASSPIITTELDISARVGKTY